MPLSPGERGDAEAVFLAAPACAVAAEHVAPARWRSSRPPHAPRRHCSRLPLRQGRERAGTHTGRRARILSLNLVGGVQEGADLEYKRLLELLDEEPLHHDGTGSLSPPCRESVCRIFRLYGWSPNGVQRCSDRNQHV
ncbi:hypothetical protein PAHAL_5G183400 [Panicum hallii]|uniref:Uncharacterized protein n=1 Tax=Panicum hallii TaxID=206008 RepID=A0A2S3HSJ1_9POAL|nr:hypothetical protein PAHAL_5G183400 [Panicum hallii]